MDGTETPQANNPLPGSADAAANTDAAAPHLTADQQFAELYDLDPEPLPPKPPVEAPILERLGAPAPRFNHPAYLRAMARDAGFSDEDIGDIGTERLGSMLQRLSLERARRSQQATHEASRQPDPVEAQPAPEPEPDLGLGDEEAKFDPALVGTLKRFAKENADLKKQVAQLAQQSQAREAESMTTRADRVFAKYTTHYGTGTLADLDPAGPEMTRRNAVLSVVSSDKSHRSLEQKMEAAHKIIYGHIEADRPAPAPAPAAPSLTAEQRRWQDAQLAIPTHRNGKPEPRGTRAAEAAVAAKLREMEDAPGESGYVSDDDFPS